MIVRIGFRGTCTACYLPDRSWSSRGLKMPTDSFPPEIACAGTGSASERATVVSNAALTHMHVLIASLEIALGDARSEAVRMAYDRGVLWSASKPVNACRLVRPDDTACSAIMSVFSSFFSTVRWMQEIRSHKPTSWSRRDSCPDQLRTRCVGSLMHAFTNTPVLCATS